MLCRLQQWLPSRVLEGVRFFSTSRAANSITSTVQHRHILLFHKIFGYRQIYYIFARLWHININRWQMMDDFDISACVVYMFVLMIQPLSKQCGRGLILGSEERVKVLRDVVCWSRFVHRHCPNNHFLVREPSFVG